MWSGSELFAEALPQLAAYIPITLLCFAVPSLVALFMGSLICYIRVGKKNLLYYLASLFVSFSAARLGLFRYICSSSVCLSWWLFLALI